MGWGDGEMGSAIALSRFLIFLELHKVRSYPHLTPEKNLRLHQD
ncbi:hypothetical protein [Microcoleus anatoxicus]